MKFSLVCTLYIIAIHTDVYLSLNGTVIPNHGYVEISGIGSTDDSALLCHTNFPPPSGSTNSGGNWWAPNGTRVHYSDVPGFVRNRAPMVVRLIRTSGTPPEGIYQCSIMDGEDVNQIVHAGLYNAGQGDFLFTVFLAYYNNGDFCRKSYNL